ncbi:MAG: hypothetical protein PHR16_00905 [Methylovulum sp.]|nr:hypothetical protein [Methylovulum sp.]
MKKMLFIIQLMMVVMFCSVSSYVFADDDYWEHRHHRPHYREVVRYYPQPRPYVREVVRYYPRPRPYYREAVRYYPQPPRYVEPQRQIYQDPRSTQGLAGGVVGSVFGYQLGGGDPLATGLGAAAGSYLGNGMAGRW